MAADFIHHDKTSESVYRRKTDYNGQKKKYKRINNDLQNIHITLKIG
jgi:Zn-finger nucleic acid-binding protein